MDPTGLAALGLGMTIFTMITNAIPTIVDRKDRILYAKHAIRSSAHIVESCRNRYTKWAGVWNWSEPSQKLRLEQLLGKEEYDAIEKRVESVARSSAIVLTMLQLTSDSKESNASKAWKDVVAWTISRIDRVHCQKVDEELPRYVHELNKFCLDTTFEPSKPTKLYQLRWVLYRKTQLKDHIDELKAGIDELLGYTDFVFHQKKLGAFDTDTFQTALHKDDFVKDANAIYDSLSTMPEGNSNETEKVIQKEPWSLILRDFEDADLVEAAKNIVRQFSLHFGCYVVGERNAPHEEDGKSNGADVACLRLRTRYDKMHPLEATIATGGQKAVLEGTFFWKSSTSNVVEIEHKTPTCAKWTASLREILCRCHKDLQLFQGLQLEFSRLAFAMCFWALLLSDTRWLSNPCSCGFRRVVKHGCLSQNTNLKEDGEHRVEYTFCSRRHGCPGIDETSPTSALTKEAGSPKESGDRKLSGDIRVLGVLLCEIFLGRPIDRVPSLTGMTWDNVKEIERQGYGKFPNSNVRNAVVSCLHGTQLANPPDSNRGSGLDLTAEGQKEFSDAVIKPLQKHFETLNKHKTRYPSTDTLMQLVTEGFLQANYETKLIHCQDKHDSLTAAKPVSKSQMRKMRKNKSQPPSTTAAVDNDDGVFGSPDTGRSLFQELEELRNLVSEFCSQDPEGAVSSDNVEKFKQGLLEKLSHLTNYIQDNMVESVRGDTAVADGRVESGQIAGNKPLETPLADVVKAGTIVRELGRVQAALSMLFEKLDIKTEFWTD